MSNFLFKCNATGACQAAIGVLSEGSGKISMNNGKAIITMKGRTVSCIGTLGGDMSSDISKALISLYCEGSTISGIGDKTGGGNVSLAESTIDITFLTGDGMGLGSPNGTLNIAGGSKSVKINE
jgi:hypothetical protein